MIRTFAVPEEMGEIIAPLLGIIAIVAVVGLMLWSSS